MPVSKKRKKDGKPVQRKAAAPVTPEEHGHGPAAEPAAVAAPVHGHGKPTNPFVAQQSRKASQRGR
jgi:hypothetical protein